MGALSKLIENQINEEKQNNYKKKGKLSVKKKKKHFKN